MKIERGSVVRLKSGGPMMTVRQKFENELVECLLFCGAELRKERIEHHCLELVGTEPMTDVLP